MKSQRDLVDYLLTYIITLLLRYSRPLSIIYFTQVFINSVLKVFRKVSWNRIRKWKNRELSPTATEQVTKLIFWAPNGMFAKILFSQRSTAIRNVAEPVVLGMEGRRGSPYNMWIPRICSQGLEDTNVCSCVSIGIERNKYQALSLRKPTSCCNPRNEK